MGLRFSRLPSPFRPLSAQYVGDDALADYVRDRLGLKLWEVAVNRVNQSSSGWDGFNRLPRAKAVRPS